MLDIYDYAERIYFIVISPKKKIYSCIVSEVEKSSEKTIHAQKSVNKKRESLTTLNRTHEQMDRS